MIEGLLSPPRPSSLMRATLGILAVVIAAWTRKRSNTRGGAGGTPESAADESAAEVDTGPKAARDNRPCRHLPALTVRPDDRCTFRHAPDDAAPPRPGRDADQRVQGSV